jgi:hypothetical protein
MRRVFILILWSYGISAGAVSAQPALSQKCTLPCPSKICAVQCFGGNCSPYCVRKEVAPEAASNSEPSGDIHIQNVTPATAAKVKELLGERAGDSR